MSLNNENTKKEKINKPLVSIIISTYNAEKYIGRCLYSIMNQTYSNLEIICVDGGSTDYTREFLGFLQQKDERITIIYQENYDIAEAKNLGLEKAKGKYLTFVEQADFIYPQCYEILVKKMEEDNGDLIIFGSECEEDITNELLEKISTENKFYENANVKNILINEKATTVCLWQHFIKRDVLEQNQPIRFDRALGAREEQLFQLEYIPYVRTMRSIQEKLCVHTFGDLNGYEKKSKNSEECNKDILLILKVLEKWKKREIFDSNKDQFITWIISLMYISIKDIPLKEQVKFAKDIFNIIQKNDLKEHYICWQEREHLEYIKRLTTVDEEAENLENFMSRLQNKNRNTSLKRKPMISVIIPTFNVEKYVKQCVDSVLNQTYRDIEVICIDDGSTDQTVDILKFLAQKDERVTLVSQKHKGVSAARNKGLDIAKGKYISFVDSDDFLQWNSYEILTQVAEKNELDLVIFGGNAVGEAPEWVWNKLNTSYKYYQKGTADNVIFEEESARPFLWLHFIKRDLFEKGQKIRFNEKLEMGEDQLCQFEYVPRAQSVMVIEDKLYNYRIGRNCSLMQLYEKQQMKKFESHILLIENVIKTWKKSGLIRTKEDQLITWIVELTYWSLITFPKSFQPQLAKKIVDLIEKYQLKKYCIAYWEKEHLEYIENISCEIITEEKEISNIKEQMEREKYQIREILKSKAFKLGSSTTPKKERMDMSVYREYIE